MDATGIVRILTAVLAPALACIAFAQTDDDDLVRFINSYRTSPEGCDDLPPTDRLRENRELERAGALTGDALQEALADTSYQAAALQVIAVTGPADATEAFEAFRSRYCEQLLSPEFSDVAVSRKNDRWQVLLAQPLLDRDLSDWPQAGREVLQKTNEARGEARRCGEQFFEPAAALRWNTALADSALVHSRDMAEQNFFSHEGSDGSVVADRAGRAGYEWRRIGENLAAGQGSPDEVVRGWLESPEHCANLMSPHFTEMGAAYVNNPDTEGGIYWTQVFGTPR